MALPPSEDPNPARPPRRRLRMMLLGLIGGVALLLPLSQVLRFQVEQLADLQAERSRLDPMLRAVAVQRGLIGHDEVATRVLRGRAALEGERRLRQAEVDRSLATLHGTLMAGHWQRASRESVALQAEWRALALAVAHRHIDAPTSGDRHRLLLEQAVQVMDLVEARALPARPVQPNAADLQLTEQVLERRQADLDRQLARLRESQAWAGVATGAAALLLACIAWQAARPAAPTSPHSPPHSPSSAAEARRRRSPGRRAGDRSVEPTPSELATLELARLGQDARDTAWPKS